MSWKENKLVLDKKKKREDSARKLGRVRENVLILSELLKFQLLAKIVIIY